MSKGGWLLPKAAASEIGVNERTLRRWRKLKPRVGPRAHRHGKRFKYRTDEVRAYVEDGGDAPGA